MLNCPPASVSALYNSVASGSLLYAIIRNYTQLYATLLYATLRYSTLLYATLRYSTLLYATRRYSTLLDATRRYSTLYYKAEIWAAWWTVRSARTFQGLHSVRLWLCTTLYSYQVLDPNITYEPVKRLNKIYEWLPLRCRLCININSTILSCR
jgi:hypothetical protein